MTDEPDYKAAWDELRSLLFERRAFTIPVEAVVKEMADIGREHGIEPGS